MIRRRTIIKALSPSHSSSLKARYLPQRIKRRYQSSTPNDSSQLPGIDTKDYFELLGVQRSFRVSQQDLKQCYRKLMNELHPDRHTFLPSQERDKITELASNVTRGYSILSNDHSRALHMLEIKGAPMEDSASTQMVGQHFLMEVMDIQEEIESVACQDELKDMKQANDKRISNVLVEMSKAFDSCDLNEAKRLTAILQYWNRIEENIMEKL